MLEILDVAIGVIFVYILVSIVCTAIREGIEAGMKTRAVYLEHGLQELLHEKTAEGTVKKIYDHPLIFGLFSGDYRKTKSLMNFGYNLPSYIPARSFAIALMDVAARGAATDAVSADPNGPVVSLESVRANVANLQNPPLQRVLLSAIDTAQGDLNRVQANIEAWFDSAMDRISGAYKRSTQWIILAIALTVTIVMNVDTIAIVNHLMRDEAARELVVEIARKNPDGTATQLKTLDLPIGWEPGFAFPAWPGLTTIVGWLLTAFAATLGAPFWFDVLNKVMVIRSTVKPHEKSPEESSEDRQKKEQAPTVTQPVAAPLTTTPPRTAVSPPPTIAGTPRGADADLEGCPA